MDSFVHKNIHNKKRMISRRLGELVKWFWATAPECTLRLTFWTFILSEVSKMTSRIFFNSNEIFEIEPPWRFLKAWRVWCGGAWEKWEPHVTKGRIVSKSETTKNLPAFQDLNGTICFFFQFEVTWPVCGQEIIFFFQFFRSA